MQFPTHRQHFGDLIPMPEDDAMARTNPPGFAWIPIEDIETYRVQISSEDSEEVLIDERRLR